MRIVAHAHTSWSYDGILTLQEWNALAREREIDAVLFAEHEETGWTADRYAEYVACCARESSADVSLIPGIEFNQDGYHVLCYGLRSWPARPSSPAELAEAAHRQGCVLCLAHPVRYGWSYPEPLLHAADAVEVWNSNWVCDGRLGPHPSSLALARGKAMLVGQDVHKPRHLSPLYIRTAGADIVSDLRNGRYLFELGARSWAPHELLQMHVAPGIQRVRTSIVRGGLRRYRTTRRALKQRLAQLGIPWPGSSAARQNGSHARNHR